MLQDCSVHALRRSTVCAQVFGVCPVDMEVAPFYLVQYKVRVASSCVLRYLRPCCLFMSLDGGQITLYGL